MPAHVRHAIRLFTALVPAVVFLLAGVAKFVDPSASLIFLKTGLTVSIPRGRWIIAAFAVAELLVGFWLAWAAGRSRRAATTAILLSSFFAGLVIAVARRHPSYALTCGCFGALQPPLGGASLYGHLMLNGALLALLIVNLILNKRRFGATEEGFTGSLAHGTTGARP